MSAPYKVILCNETKNTQVNLWKYCRRKKSQKISKLNKFGIKIYSNAHHIYTGKPEYFGGEECLAKKAQAKLRKPQKTAVLQVET